MYNLNITNDYRFDVKVNEKVATKGGGTCQLSSLGNAIFEIPGMGSLVALDLGNKKFDGYPLEQTWGVLFRYKTNEVYARYEGEGSFNLAIDQYGSVTIKAINGEAIVVVLNELTINN